MNKFPDKIELEDAGMRGSSRLFKLTADFRFYSSKGLITVPKGFITDGASIPKMFWSIFAPFGQYFQSALIHDWLYSSNNKQFTREEADFLLNEGMIILGVPWIQRVLILRTVRIFGGFAYKGLKK